GSRLLSFYGQHEHRKLMLQSVQLDLLDAHCGVEHMAMRDELGALYERVAGLEARAQELRELAGARDRELDLLTFEIEEIEAAAPSEEEHAELLAERERLRHLEALRGAAADGSEAIAPEAGDGVIESLARAARALEPVVGIDPALQSLHERLDSARYELEELGGELRRYALGVEGAPGRLEEVEGTARPAGAPGAQARRFDRRRA